MTKPTKRIQLGSLLLERGLITSSQLEIALEEQKHSGKPLGRTLIELGFVKEQNVLDVLGLQAGIKIINLDEIKIVKDVIEMIPASVAKVYKILPIEFKDNTLTVVMADALNVNVIDDLRFMLGVAIKRVSATEEQIERSLKKYYETKEESLEEILKDIKSATGDAQNAAIKNVVDIEKLQELASQTPIIKLLNLIILNAIKDRATDIHFEPFEEGLKVRYRVDGVLFDVMQPPKSLTLALISRIKVMANMDIAENRLPQDGRVLMEIEARDVDLRISSLPMVFGEGVVIRILDKGLTGLSLDQLGLEEDSKLIFRHIINKPNGIVLVTGPTGCGKTTTLYSSLKAINKIEYKIITIEDPVEYDVDGVIQIGIRPKINLTFAQALRHILRHDPDIIMVGEIRDPETAQISIQASLTGHLVFSTLHTNDAPGAITRLIDMGIEPFLINSTLEAILAQRLVRVICTHCKEEYFPSDSLIAELGFQEMLKGKKFFRGKGCNICNNTGFKGQTGIFELLVLNDELRSLITEKVQTAVLRKCAQDRGMRTLREDGLLKIVKGITTPEEVIRETQVYM
ncbi:MAG: type II secretion system ATPase GspE [Candidatus Omnitrophota bacterium]